MKQVLKPLLVLKLQYCYVGAKIKVQPDLKSLVAPDAAAVYVCVTCCLSMSIRFFCERREEVMSTNNGVPSFLSGVA